MLRGRLETIGPTMSTKRNYSVLIKKNPTFKDISPTLKFAFNLDYFNSDLFYFPLYPYRYMMVSIVLPGT